jgi:hypothetical protein
MMIFLDNQFKKMLESVFAVRYLFLTIMKDIKSILELISHLLCFTVRAVQCQMQLG